MVVEFTNPIGHRLGLEPGEVHVWSADLRFYMLQLDYFESQCSPDELARANRFHFRQERTSFLCARGLLREMLAGYRETHPRALQFAHGQFGKPRLIGGSGPWPTFSYSRSGNMALYAFSLQREVGVDIEQIVDDFGFKDIVLQYYSCAESKMIDSLEQGAGMALFFQLWTRREAYVKATGEGLNEMNSKLDLSASILRRATPAGFSEWRVETLDLLPNYACSVALEGTNWYLRCFQTQYPEAASALPTNAA